MSFDLLNLWQFKHLSAMYMLQLTQNVLQYLHFNLLQNLQSFNDGKISFTKKCYFFNNYCFQKLDPSLKKEKIKKKKKKNQKN